MMEKRIAVVTGASSGIGAAIAQRLGRLGYLVVLAARRRQSLEQIAEKIVQSAGEALVVPTDLTQQPEIDRLVATTIDTWGKVDILINNAGFGRLNWLEELAPRPDIELQLQVNLTGVILLTRTMLPHMIQRRAGHIINMASLASFIAPPTYTVYSASKFGLRGFTDALRREVRVWGIHVTGIYPGSVATGFGQRARAQAGTRFSTPKRLVLEPEDVARAVEGALRRPRAAIILPPVMRTVVWFEHLFPGFLDRILTGRFGLKQPRI